MKNYHLSNEELNSFYKNGYVGPFTLYEKEEMHEIWNKIRYQLHDKSKAPYQETNFSGSTNISNYDRHLDINLLSEHVCKDKIVDRVKSILGNNVLCWRTEFFPKYKGDEGTDWHQADTFANASGSPQILWPEEDNIKAGQGTITVWCAFTEATIENGCLQFIPGTHGCMNYDEAKRMKYNPEKINLVNKNDVKRGFFGYDYRELQIDPNWKPNESEAISMVMEAGQFIIFWSTLMHASHPHLGKTNNMRMGYATRYVPTRVRIYPDTDYIEEYGGKISLSKYGAVLVSGEDTYKHNRILRNNLLGIPFETNKNKYIDNLCK